jgi:CheY-like chemotaxis protein
MAPWPGSVNHWLDSIRAKLQAQQRVLLICPPEACRQLPASQGLRLQHLAQPVAVNALRQALTGLYEEPKAQVHQLVRNIRSDSSDAPCILVAEDNPVNQLVVQGFLKKRGYGVRLVTNGQAAVDEYSRDPAAVQLILMDCEMPVMDGFEATRQIRRLEHSRQLSAVPVIALTAHILEEHRQHGLDAGMNDFLGKPLDSGLLYSTLERFLKHSGNPV